MIKLKEQVLGDYIDIFGEIQLDISNITNKDDIKRIKSELKELLNEEKMPGLYFVYDIDDNLVYIGESKNVRKRVGDLLNAIFLGRKDIHSGGENLYIYKEFKDLKNIYLYPYIEEVDITNSIIIYDLVKYLERKNIMDNRGIEMLLNDYTKSSLNLENLLTEYFNNNYQMSFYIFVSEYIKINETTK